MGQNHRILDERARGGGGEQPVLVTLEGRELQGGKGRRISGH